MNYQNLQLLELLLYQKFLPVIVYANQSSEKSDNVLPKILISYISMSFPSFC